MRIAIMCFLSLSLGWLTPAHGQELWSCQARALNDAQVLLVWQPLAAADAYRVYRTTSQGGSVDASVDFMATASNHYLDSGLLENGTYFYRVVAENAAGDVIATSPEVSAITAADSRAAKLLSVKTPNAMTVELQFDEAVALGEDLSIFEIPGTVIESATLGTTPGQVFLHTAPQTAGVATLKVRGLVDEGFTPNATSSTARFTTSGALLGSFPLDEGSGTEILDRTGHGLVGTVVGAQFDAEGLTFAGGTDRVMLPEMPVGGRTLTLASWVRVDSFATGEGRIISKAVGNGEQDHIWMVGFMSDEWGHRLRFRVRAGDTTTTLVADATTFPPFEWVHVAVTYNGSWMRIYQNGAMVGSVMKSGDLDAGVGVPAALGNQPQGDRPFTGGLRDVRVYSRALQSEEVQFLAAPMARPVGDLGAVEFGGSTVIPVLENDDLGSPLVGAPWIDVVMPPLYGTVEVDANGNVHYHHLGTSIEADRFTYMLRNPTFPSPNKATVEISVATTPLWTSGLVLQLDAANGVVTDGNTVTAWNDLSGSANHLMMMGAPEHVTGALRGRQVVHFDASSHAQNSGSLAGLPNGSADRTVVAVLHYASGGEAVSIGTPQCGEALTLGRLDELGALTVGNGCGDMIGAPVANRGWFVQSVTLEDGEARMYVDGVMLANGAAPLDTTMTSLLVAGGCAADVAAILVYDYALSESTHEHVYEYLRQHYFLDGDGTPQCATDFVRAPRGGTCPIFVLENDHADLGVDATTVELVDAPAFGVASVDPVTGVVTYTHSGATLLPDRLSYVVRDMLGVQSVPTEVWIGIDGYDCSLARDGVVLHLDAGRGVATDESGSVTAWRDSTSLENDLMATGAAEWLPAVANGHAAVQLDGASLVRSGALRGFPVGDADRTMLMVTRSDAAGATGAGAIRYGENSCGADFGVGLGSVTLANGCTPAAAVQQSGGWSVLSVTLDGGVYAVHENGNLLESSNAALQTPGMRFLIDGSGVQVAEVVLYDHALGDIERQRAEAYLREKYVDGICDPPCLMPRVVSDLTDRAVCAGSDVLLSVGATGDGIEFEWYRDDQRIVGASSATLQVSPQAPGTVETYQVRVVSFCGETWSSVASVRSLLAAQLLAAPGDYHLCPGDSVDLQVQATGSELTYEWAIDGVVQPMATSSTYSIVADAASAPIRMFQVTVSNGCSAIATPPFEVCVEQTPVITQQPGSRSACAGDDVTLSAAVDAPLPVDYQWFHGGVALVGETSAELVLNAVEAADSGSYAVQVSNRCGTATSDAALFMVGMPPQFVVEPVADSAFCPGAALEMSAVVSGDGNLYQWQRDGVPIPGALDADLLISPLSAGDAGAYELVVSNVCGTVTSVAVAVSVREPLAITSQPTGGSLCAGDGVLLTAAAAGDVEVWQWRRDGVAIPGATTAQLVLGGLQVSDSGRYDVVASGPCGAVTSNGADVLVHGVPEILVGLTPLTTCEGFDVELTVLANGSGDLGYQWRLDGLNLAGATSATLVVSGATLADAGVYDVVVTSACGAATADGALLTVLAQQQCDCDANGVLDGDDLASGFATDCNNNGVIDSCDIAAGTSVDANSDGIPDDCTGRFLRGDVNGDEAHTLADSIVLLNFVFSQNNAGPLDCHDAADFNDDGELNLIDVVGNMMYTFALGAFPAAPFPSCGADPTHDALGCDRMACQ